MGLQTVTWHKALEAAAHLSVALDEHFTSPEVSEVYVEWRSFGMDLIGAFKKNQFLTLLAPSHEGLAVIRLRCIRVIRPMYNMIKSNTFSNDQLPYPYVLSSPEVSYRIAQSTLQRSGFSPGGQTSCRNQGNHQDRTHFGSSKVALETQCNSNVPV